MTDSQSTPNPYQTPAGNNPAVEIQPEVVRKPDSNWPTILGIVGIAFGIFGAIGGVAGVVTNLLFLSGGGFFGDIMQEAAAQDGSMEVAMKYAGLNAAVATISTLVALWLLTAGIMILQRRPACRMVSIGWAMAKTMLTLVATGVGVFVQIESLQAVAAGPLGDMQAVIWAIAIFSALFGLAWGLALPIFVLYWFARAKTKAEIAAWE